MTILEAIENANKELEIRSFRFANLDEYNKFLESFTFEDYPCNVIVPVETRQEWLNNRVHNVAVIQGWMLKRIDTDTNNTKTRELEIAAVQPMRTLAMKFMRRLLGSDIVDPEVERVTSNVKPEYGQLSARLFGVSYIMNLPVDEKVC